MRVVRCLFVLAGCVACASAAFAHVDTLPSVHDTVAQIVERLRAELTPEELGELTEERVLEFLTEDDKEALATRHLNFTVNVPVIVTVLQDTRVRTFWLEDRGFEKTGERVMVGGTALEAWQKRFEPGLIGLGVNSLSGGQDHYLVALQPENAEDELEVYDIYPGQHTLGVLTAGERAWADRSNRLTEVPGALEGQVMIRGLRGRRDVAKLLNVFRITPYPSSEKPDHVLLTWSGDPRTTQTIQWRTSEETPRGVVAYIKKADHHTFQPKSPRRVEAQSRLLETPFNVNDPLMYRHTAELTGLEPGTTYLYQVGDGSDENWTELAEFTTAPDGIRPFSFIYMGDAQNGLERWGSIIRQAYRERPDAAFYVMAGDLVNRGGERDDFDSLFENAQGIWDRRPVVPALGNHEYQAGEPKLYLDMFELPKNGPEELGPEKLYSFEYSNALFVIMDSNQPAAAQAEWLEAQLANSTATWKFVVYHHPAYSSSPNRDNREIRRIWGGLFDKYHVDFALQGHDHAYLRTYPMYNEQRVDSPAEGTIYVVSVSGTKMYDLGEFDYTEFGMSNTSTYQVLDIHIHGDRLIYRAYDIDGNLRDEVIIEK